MSERWNELCGRSVCIAGYGREGKSVSRWLKKHYPDLRIEHRDKITDGDSYLDHLDSFDTIIRSPGVSPFLPPLARYISNGGFVTTSTNMFFSRVKGTTIGVTGTKGKSTTSSLIAHIASGLFTDVRLVGNIGTPMLDELDSSTTKTVFVIELSSHQLVDIRYSPHIAVLLDIVPEHMDYYPDFDSYKRAKENIFRFQKQGDHVIKPAVLDIQLKTQLLGNIRNVSCSVQVARLMGMSDALIASAIESFKPLPHRLEFVGEFCGIRFYNDSLATIPEATIHALTALGADVVTLIAGGYDRGLSYEKLGKFLAKSSVKTLILFPDTGMKIHDALLSHYSLCAIYHVTTMEDAVRLAYKHTPKGKMCLLSPASASYNLFRDFADRGNQFSAWVKKLGG